MITGWNWKEISTQNSGIYLFKAGVLLQELRLYAQEVWEACERAFLEGIQLSQNETFVPDMEHIPEISIDQAVMERSKCLKMVALNAGWSDIGTIESLGTQLRSTSEGNTERPGLLHVNASGNTIIAGKKTIALIDVHDLIIIETDDSLFISKKGTSHKVKQLFKKDGVS